MSLENEAKKMAATYARWLRNPEEALFGKGGRGVVMQVYEKIKNAKTKEEIIKALDLSSYQNEISKQTFNDLSRFFTELSNKISQMNDGDAMKFAVEAFRYFQIALFTKIEDINKGFWA